MRAWLNLRYTVPERRKAFSKGLKRLGYKIEVGIPSQGQIEANDILVTWNRIGAGDRAAKWFEKRGLPVLVTENASWGNSFAGKRWYTIARTHHNTAGCFPVGDPIRWDSLNVTLPEWRIGGETVILPQRGIGSDPTKMPNQWPAKALRKYGGRIRNHPGRRDGIPLDEDLANCGHVVTWGSGAAIKALLMGIKVTSEMPDWIGSQDNTAESRLDMLRRLAWAQWTLEEIADGLPFRRLL